MRIPFLSRGEPASPSSAEPASPDPAAEPVDPVLVYGSTWCVDCHVVTRYLDRTGVPYRWIDLAKDAAAQQMISDLGYRAIPVVMLPDGRTLVEPSARELGDALAAPAQAG
ncbi:MAG: glutaredoxin domain-containing protein [Chloroflexota bacterium]